MKTSEITCSKKQLFQKHNMFCKLELCYINLLLWSPGAWLYLHWMLLLQLGLSPCPLMAGNCLL